MVDHAVVVLLLNSRVQFWLAVDHVLLLGASFACFLYSPLATTDPDSSVNRHGTVLSARI